MIVVTITNKVWLRSLRNWCALQFSYLFVCTRLRPIQIPTLLINRRLKIITLIQHHSLHILLHLLLLLLRYLIPKQQLILHLGPPHPTLSSRPSPTRLPRRRHPPTTTIRTPILIPRLKILQPLLLILLVFLLLLAAVVVSEALEAVSNEGGLSV